MTIKVPGVNKILGTFSSNCKGPAVCTPDNQELSVNFENRNDTIVKVCLAKTGECKKFQLGSIKVKKDDKWCNAVKGVYIIMEKEFGNLPCFDIEINGSLVECEGHIVFSALTLATIQAIDKTLKLKLDSERMLKLAGDALHIICEDGNLVDIITMLYAKKGQIISYDGMTQQYKIIENPFTGTPYSMVFLDPHLPVSTLREEVQAKEKEIYEANRVFSDVYTGCRLLQLSSSDFKDRIMGFDEDVKRYCTYLFEEARAAMSVELLIQKKNLYALENMCTKIRESYEENLEFICPEINWIVKRAYENSGCIGAFPVFEGWKTKTVVICKNETLDAFASNAEEYTHIFGFEITAEVVGDYVPKAR